MIKHNYELQDLLVEFAKAKAEIERLRAMTKKLATAIVTGQRYEGLICQAEDFLQGERAVEV